MPRRGMGHPAPHAMKGGTDFNLKNVAGAGTSGLADDISMLHFPEKHLENEKGPACLEGSRFYCGSFDAEP